MRGPRQHLLLGRSKAGSWQLSIGNECSNKDFDRTYSHWCCLKRFFSGFARSFQLAAWAEGSFGQSLWCWCWFKQARIWSNKPACLDQLKSERVETCSDHKRVSLNVNCVRPVELELNLRRWRFSSSCQRRCWHLGWQMTEKWGWLWMTGLSVASTNGETYPVVWLRKAPPLTRFRQLSLFAWWRVRSRDQWFWRPAYFLGKQKKW